MTSMPFVIGPHVSIESGEAELSPPVQVQCVMQFLRLPIEDDLAEISPQQPLGISVNGSGPVLAPSEQPIPFADTGNPIMAQVTDTATIDQIPTQSAAPPQDKLCQE